MASEKLLPERFPAKAKPKRAGSAEHVLRTFEGD
jgi:hypothetical protein